VSGAHVSDPAAHCAGCGHEVLPGARFCRYCGHPVGQPLPPEPEPMAAATEAGTPVTAEVDALVAGTRRYVTELDVDLIGPADPVRSHRIELRAEPAAPVFAVHVEAIALAARATTLFAGDATVTIGRDRLVGVIGADRLLLFEQPHSAIDEVELTRSVRRRAQSLLVTSAQPPYALRITTSGRRATGGAFVDSGDEALAEVLVAAAAADRLTRAPAPALRRRLERLAAGEWDDVAEFHLPDPPTGEHTVTDLGAIPARGGRTAIDALALPSAPAEPAPPNGRTRRRRTAGVLAALALLVAAAVAAIVLTRPGDEPAAADRGARTDAPAPTATASAQPEDTATPAPAGEAFVAGRYARLGSFRTDTRAQEVAAQMQAKGVPAEVISSDDGLEMVPAFSVVVAGPLETPKDERELLRSARRAGAADAFVDDLVPATATADPAALAGATFTGALRQTNPKAKHPNRTITTTMALGADGRDGEVAYTRPNCAGTLTLSNQHGSVLVYDEAITSGRCSDGGRWHLRLEGDTLRATWWREDDFTFVLGQLTRSAGR
jgi:hypothetical protein